MLTRNRTRRRFWYEYAFAPNWSAKLEYDHVGYLSRNVDLGMISTNDSVITNAVKAGINYKLADGFS